MIPCGNSAPRLSKREIQRTLAWLAAKRKAAENMARVEKWRAEVYKEMADVIEKEFPPVEDFSI